MRKIADTNELQAELRRLLAYAQTEQPSRSVLAGELEALGARLAGDKTAAEDARAVTDRLFKLKNNKMETAFQAVKTIRQEMDRIPTAAECDPEQDDAFQHIVKAQNEMEECLESLKALFDKMGWK